MAHGGYDKVLKLWRKAAIFESFSAAYDETETLYRFAECVYVCVLCVCVCVCVCVCE